MDFRDAYIRRTFRRLEKHANAGVTRDALRVLGQLAQVIRARVGTYSGINFVLTEDITGYVCLSLKAPDGETLSITQQQKFLRYVGLNSRAMVETRQLVYGGVFYVLRGAK